MMSNKSKLKFTRRDIVLTVLTFGIYGIFKLNDIYMAPDQEKSVAKKVSDKEVPSEFKKSSSLLNRHVSFKQSVIAVFLALSFLFSIAGYFRESLVLAASVLLIIYSSPIIQRLRSFSVWARNFVKARKVALAIFLFVIIFLPLLRLALRATYVHELNFGQLASMITAFTSLVIALAAYYYSHLKPGSADVFQTHPNPDVRFTRTVHGMPRALIIRTPFYIENTGGAKTTVLSITLAKGLDFDGDHYKLSDSTAVLGVDGEPLKTPFILADGDVIQCYGQLTLVTERRDIDAHNARSAGKNAQKDLKSFPQNVTASVNISFRDGRGAEKKTDAKIQFKIDDLLRAQARAIEEAHKKASWPE